MKPEDFDIGNEDNSMEEILLPVWFERILDGDSVINNKLEDSKIEIKNNDNLLQITLEDSTKQYPSSKH